MKEILETMHPAVRMWFEGKFPLGPTPPQEQAWGHIAARRNTLVAAPTGSGKTLAALLIAIDNLYKAHASGENVEQQTQVVYVSPLKALATDISENLQRPLREIAECARKLGFEPPDLTVFVRSGDTPQSERAAALKKPPTFVITTPESFYLLLTAEKSREMLRTAKTVIVDEIHAVARDKRGSHLALSLERLEHICDAPPTRIGLSATQRPLEVIARLLVGVNRPCEIVDIGHQRNLDIALHFPDTEPEAVASHEQTAEVLAHIAELVKQHRTTLVFVNTRRMAERIAHQLGEVLGEGEVAAHHGSLSKDRRLRVEARLRAGDLKALVATASLELGIDIGPVELVCQLGSPRSIAVFLQRVGRSNHSRYGTPKGRLFPFTRDELVECAALMRAVRDGRLDAVEPPIAPRDILVQQLVAEAAAENWKTDELYRLVRQAAPYSELAREDFDEALGFACEGVACGHGQKGAYLRWDRVNNEVSARRAARLAAITSGGAIPDVADYRVVLDPDDTFIGTVHEDWAVESMAGDIFLLGTHSWRIRRVERGIVRVVDAEGAPPTLPFWLGEAPGRTAELSEEVGALRELVEEHLHGKHLLVDSDSNRQINGLGLANEDTEHSSNDPDAAELSAPSSRPDADRLRRAAAELEAQCGIPSEAAAFIVNYLAASRKLLGTLPSHRRIVVERFFDETGGMQLVVHNPRGSRVNRGFGLALRKRFCRTFDFELQAAANDDAIVLSLGPQHSFPLEEIARYVTSSTAEEVLEQAVLPTPIFSTRWRWNLNRALTVLRFKGGKRNPPQIQRMEADDVMAAVFPSLAACQDNAAGPNIEIPDHLLVRQTVSDALREALDIDRLKGLLQEIEEGSVEMHFIDTPEPSPLSHEVLNGKPFTFLDDAPLEERRTQAVAMRRGLDPSLIAEPEATAIERVREEVAPAPRDADELHDVLSWLVAMPAREEWRDWFSELAERSRAAAIFVKREIGDSAVFGTAEDETEPASNSQNETKAIELWNAAEMRDEVAALWPQAQADTNASNLEDPLTQARAALWPNGQADTSRAPAEQPSNLPADPAEAAVKLLRGHLDITGPITATELAATTALPLSTVRTALAELETQGYVLQGNWEPTAMVTAATDLSSTPSEQAADANRPTEPASQNLIAAETQWCARRLLLRIHHYSKKKRRSQTEPVTAQDFMRFLLRWQHVAPGCQVRGTAGLRRVIEQLQGWELPAASWEEDVLARRVASYTPGRLDELCMSGEVVWGRFSPSSSGRSSGGSSSSSRTSSNRSGPSRATPITLAMREDTDWLLAAIRGEETPELPEAGATAEILEALEAKGARFLAELAADTGRLPTDVENGLGDGIARGLLTADSFGALRSLLNRTRTNQHFKQYRPPIPNQISRGNRRRWRSRTPRVSGRWALLPSPEIGGDPDELAELFAEQLLARWGVVFRDVFVLENSAIPWRDVLWALRRLEARGIVRGGRFVTGFTGEQFALPEAAADLRFVRRQPRNGQQITLNATDPLNLTGPILGTPRIPAVRTRQFTLKDGLPQTPADDSSEMPASLTTESSYFSG